MILQALLISLILAFDVNRKMSFSQGTVQKLIQL